MCKTHLFSDFTNFFYALPCLLKHFSLQLLGILKDSFVEKFTACSDKLIFTVHFTSSSLPVFIASDSLSTEKGGIR